MTSKLLNIPTFSIVETDSNIYLGMLVFNDDNVSVIDNGNPNFSNFKLTDHDIALK